jgi:hypothetical protein
MWHYKGKPELVFTLDMDDVLALLAQKLANEHKLVGEYKVSAKATYDKLIITMTEEE